MDRAKKEEEEKQKNKMMDFLGTGKTQICDFKDIPKKGEETGGRGKFGGDTTNQYEDWRLMSIARTSM